LLFKGRANPGKLPEIATEPSEWRSSWQDSPSCIGEFSQPGGAGSETCAAAGVGGAGIFERWKAMLGKLAGAWLGSRIAGRHQGAKGALFGYGAAALARRSVPALAVLALAGWGFNKLRERRRRSPTYPSEAAPSSPSA
jgi:hypothetical protein